jgi:NAD(P)-dependent dehydrogenase (short-subunit alcohol dehydrogenase family)
MNRIAVVTGANRGIGREVARQLADQGDVVYLTARQAADAEAAVIQLGSAANLRSHQLDVTDSASVDRLVASVESEHRRLDVLINNAAILYDTWQGASTADLRVVHEALETNLFGAWRVTLAFLPLLRRAEQGRIVNVSSGAASLAQMSGGTPAYRTSKAALNALTRMLAAELRRDGILVNSIDPGWVATDMGGPGGGPVADGAAGVVWAANLPASGPSGGFFYDARPVPW